MKFATEGLEGMMWTEQQVGSRKGFPRFKFMDFPRKYSENESNWREFNPGYRMAFASDYYDYFQCLTNSNNNKMKGIFMQHIKRWMLSDTHIKYTPGEKKAMIWNSYSIDNFLWADIPEYRLENMENVLKKKEGHQFIKLLFQTVDPASEIINNLKSTDAESITLATVPLDKRQAGVDYIFNINQINPANIQLVVEPANVSEGMSMGVLV